MKRDSTKNNFVFQFMYQFVVLVIPLFVSPYLTRTLGDTQLGVYTYSYTIAYYFVIVAMLGINKYGQRLISSAQDDDFEIRKRFWSLFVLHILISSVITILYLILVLAANFENKDVFLALSLYVASALFDITWFFYGIEKFKNIVLRNLLIKILECVLIFVFVKSKNDVLIYTYIKSGSTLFSQLVMYGFIFKNVKPIKFSIGDMMVHVKPLLAFSIFVIASLLYSVFDKTLLGILCSKEDVAYYEYANKIIDIPRTFSLVLPSVIFPRACMYVKQGKKEEINMYLKICMIFVYYICFGSICGVFFIANDFAVLYYGQDFISSGEVMRWLMPVILFISICNVLESLFLIPNEKEKPLTICIVVGAIVNVGLSSLFIYLFGIYGAIIGTLIAEFVQLIMELYFCRQYLNMLKMITLSAPFAMSGMIMAAILFLMTTKLETTHLNLIIEIVVGFLTYTLLICMYFFFIDKDKLYYRTKFKKLFLRRKNK